jgi:sugar lactone lactonase YvrE
MGIPSQRSKVVGRPLVVILIIALLVVGGFAALYFQGIIGPRKSQEFGQSASLVLGQKDFASTSQAASPTSYYFVHVLFDSAGNMWVADYNNNRVLEFKPPFSTGMNASLVIGQRDFKTSLAGSSADMLSGPVSIAFDSSGNLWVVDNDDSRVLEFTPPFKTGMPAALVMGQSQAFNTPHGIVIDSSGDIWILDSGNNRVLEFVPPFTSGMNASLVIGQDDFRSTVEATTQSGLNSLYGGLAMDQTGDLWVGDAQNNRVLEFKPPFSSGMDASTVIGQSSLTSQGVPNDCGHGVPLYVWPVFDHSGNLWVSSDCKLQEFKPPFTTGMKASFELLGGWLVGGQPAGGQKGILTGPGTVGFDASGNLWVPDVVADRVLEFTQMGSG